MNSASAAEVMVDEARSIICHRFAQMLNGGSNSLRVRIICSANKPEAWFYSHDGTGWHKSEGAIVDAPLVQAIEEALNMVASQQHSDGWSAWKHKSRDHHDIDVHFHRDAFAHRLGNQLEFELAGLLFRDRHDSRKDERHAIRPPRPAAPRSPPS
jgi:hypothetical protein